MILTPLLNFYTQSFSFQFDFNPTHLDFTTAFDANLYKIDWLYLTFFFKYDLIQNSNLNDNFYFYTNFINQLEDLNLSNNLENITSVYHYSIPNTKLFYPEPFIASASFMHSDLWFVHILIYQYWLWFVFIFLIVFFFITFLTVVRWCNMRTRPRRETRGVSRSKCGDLITAFVPVSWATSIIVNESTDAIDFYDGFGTTELVVGIRAYQWGWEYYYPKDIDLNYNVKKNYSTFIGNSLKYNSTSSLNLKANNLWKSYQNKNFDTIVTPAHLLLLSIDNYKIFNFLNFNDIGANPMIEAAAFKRTKLFFKFNNANLFYTPNLFNDKYKNFSKLYVNDLFFHNSSFYELKHQYNFLTNSNYNKNILLNSQNINKLINYNFNNKFTHSDILKKKTNLNFLNKINNMNYDFFNTYFNKIIFKNIFLSNKLLFNKQQVFPNVNSLINLNNKIKINYPMLKTIPFLNNNKFNANYNNLNVFKITDVSENSFYLNKNKFTNVNKLFKRISMFSSNKMISITDRFVKNYTNLKPNVSNYNLLSNLNPLNNYKDNLNQNLFGNLNFFYNISRTNWIEFNTFYKLANDKINTNLPHYPIISDNYKWSYFDYDNFNHPKSTNETPFILQKKDGSLINSIYTTYWNFYLSNTQNNWRLQNDLKFINNSTKFYLPIFTLYSDYDFKNKQSIKILENTIWDNVYPNYVYEEYETLFNNFYKYTYNDELINFYFNINKKRELIEQFTNDSLFSDKNDLNEYYVNYFFTDDFNTNINLLNTNNFVLFYHNDLFINLDETYENLKYLANVYNLIYKINFNFNLNFFPSHSYTLISDCFRSNYEETNWFDDNNDHFSNFNFNENKNFDYDFDNFNEIKSNRINNNLNLRNTTKNSIINYNAVQKVFKSRFDEARSNTNMLEFSNFYVKQPILNSNKVSYEKLLGKNKENFYKSNFYKSKFYTNFNTYYDVFNFLNFQIFDFPFLLGMQNDSSKHFWIDWAAKWKYCTIQPASNSKYALHGMPFFNKFFDFNDKNNSGLKESENYLTRLSRARKNYIPNWTYTPYFYLKNNQWYKNNLFFENLYEFKNNLILLKLNLNLINTYWTQLTYESTNNHLFIPSISNLNSYGKSTWRPFTSISAYYYNISNLIDILTKREYLYRQLLLNNGKIINIPIEFTNNPRNQLILDLKSNFAFVDTIISNNEYSKELYYNSLKFFNFNVLQNFANLNKISELIFFYFFNSAENDKLNNNLELYKNQYRPLKKGVNNMLRLHASNAVAMPIEIRLQILASSKDVIHSWAVPSAGVKIDCVPGYSSHKVIIFLVSGIFWGQCMEICGRYHHWMPIIVYFMKRDLFFLWCTHFVFSTNNNNNSLLNINDRQNINHIRLVSHDKNSWLNEFKK